ncbi:MAG: hypothetical protein ACTHPS_10320 [Streptosporangiaceae bacterium]
MTTLETRGRAELDQRVPTSFYWSLTLLATLGGFRAADQGRCRGLR